MIKVANIYYFHYVNMVGLQWSRLQWQMPTLAMINIIPTASSNPLKGLVPEYRFIIVSQFIGQSEDEKQFHAVKLWYSGGILAVMVWSQEVVKPFCTKQEFKAGWYLQTASARCVDWWVWIYQLICFSEVSFTTVHENICKTQSHKKEFIKMS